MIFLALDHLNLLKTPFNLNFQQKSSISTRTGLLLSLVILTLLIIFSMQNDIFFHKSPYVLDSTQRLQTSPSVNFSRKIKGIQVCDDTNNQLISDPSLFEFMVEVLYYNNSNVSDYSITYKSLHQCTIEDFPEDPSIFSLMGFSNYFCIDGDDNDVEIKGSWNEPIMKYFNIQMLLCDNETKNNTCVSYEAMKEKLQGSIFNIYLYDTLIDASDLNSPLKHVLSTQWVYVDLNMKKDKQFFFQNVKISTDDGFLFQSEEEESDVQLADRGYELFLVDETDLITPRVSFSFIANPTVRNVSRTYQKITDLMAALGGALNTLVFVGMFWASFENRLLVRKTILNEMYRFKRKKSKVNKRRNAMELSSKNWESTKNESYVANLEPHEKKHSLNIVEINEVIQHEKSQKLNIIEENEGDQFKKEDPKTKQHSNHVPFFILPKVLEEENNGFPNQESEKKIGLEPENEITFKVKKINENNEFSREVTLSNKKRKFFGKSKSGFNNKEQNILKFQEFKNHINSKKIDINPLKYLKLKIKIAFKLKLNEEEEILQQTNDLCSKNLDYIEIMKKIQEIDKLKHIILDEKQLKLFQFVSKPLIYINCDKNTQKKETFFVDLKQKNENDKEELKGMLHYFEDLKTKGQLTEIDKRLLWILDRDLEKFIRNCE